MEIRNPHLAKLATGNAEDDLFLLRFSMYLHTVVRRTSAAYWTRQRRVESREICVDVNEIDDVFEAPESNLIQEMQGFALMDSVSDDLLLTALKALTEKQRDVLTAYVVDDCPVAEIAQRRKTSSVSVYKLLTRALTRLGRQYRRESQD